MKKDSSTSFPDFLLIGAAKCGTTALVNQLRTHPQIYWSPVKEPHFFSQFDTSQFSKNFRQNNVFDVNAYFEADRLDDCLQLFITDPDQYSRLFEEAGDHQIKGEASTSYLYEEEAVKNIARQCPEAKIIAILRDPVERAFSHYTMALKYGYTRDDFLTAIVKDQQSDPKGWGRSELFLELGHYAEQLKRYHQYFDSSQIHIILYEDWKDKTLREIDEVTDFLGISRMKTIDRAVKNPGENPRHLLLNRWLHQMGLRQRLAHVIPDRIKKKLRPLYFKPKDEAMLTPDAKTYLKDYYRYRIEELEDFIQRDLTIWKD